MSVSNTLAAGREGEAMDIVGSLGLPVHYKLPPDAQAVVDAAATGCPQAICAYADMLAELSALNGLTDKESCALVEPVALLAAVNGGPEAHMFLARNARRLSDVLRDDRGPLSHIEEGRKLSGWWQAAGIYEQLARHGHEPAKAELLALLEQMSADGVAHAASALRLFQAAGLV